MSATRRIQREADNLKKKPCREFLAYPSEQSPFTWFFTMRGPEDTPYEQGVYHGKLLLPTNYPYAPPDVMLMTPNGRFELSVKICLSEVTSYHPENWQPSWGVHTVLHALRSFMSTPGTNAVGAIQYPESERRRMAEESRMWQSEQGARMQDHLAVLDAAPKWEDRETAQAASAVVVEGGGGEAGPARSGSTASAAPEQEQQQSASSSAEAQPGAAVREGSVGSVAASEAGTVETERQPAAAVAEEEPQGGGGGGGGAQPQARLVDAVTAVPVTTPAWELNESTLDSIVFFLLMGIFAILSRKYIFSLLDEDTTLLSLLEPFSAGLTGA